MRWLARRADRDRAALGHSGSDDGSMSAPSSPKATGEKTSPVLGGGHDHTDERGEVDYASKQAHFDVYILEAGIIFHSIVRLPSSLPFESAVGA
jgi:zinc transporter 1/2/3